MSTKTRRSWVRNKFIWIPLAVIIVSAPYLVWDYRGPTEIPLQLDNAWGLPCLRAKDLLIQGHDEEGNIWATRGMVAYRRIEGDNKFINQYHIPTGFSIFWLRNFSIVRRITLRPECVEFLPLENGQAVAMSAGCMWYRPGHGKKFRETLTLPHYGIGIGQGVRNAGLAKLGDGSIVLGEYFMNKDKTAVKLFSSKDNGKTWQVVKSFPPGRIRHVHAVQQDPYSKKAWICTGDANKETMLAWTQDGGQTLNPIGKGSQIWRVCQIAFTEDALFFGTDTGESEYSGIYRWDRESHNLIKLIYVPGCIFYATRLADGLIVMSTNREGVSNEKDDKTRLWNITPGNNVSSIPCGTW